MASIYSTAHLECHLATQCFTVMTKRHPGLTTLRPKRDMILIVQSLPVLEPSILDPEHAGTGFGM